MTHIDTSLILNAIVALKKQNQKSDVKEYSNICNTSLFIPDIPIHVQLSLSEVPRRPNSRPIRIDIPHPLHKLPCLDGSENYISDKYEQEVSVCIFVKDTSKKWANELISRYTKQLHFIKKVLTLSSLKKKYGAYASRRELIHQFDIFLVDDRILPMLAKLLGQNFFKAKKQPVPVTITRKEALPLAVERCLRATFMYINPGTCVTIKAGNTGMSNDKLCANILAVVTNAVPKLPRKWEILSSILIKTPYSVSLPVYNKIRDNYEQITIMMKGETGNFLLEEDSHADDECKNRVNQSCKVKKIFKKPRLSTKSPLLRALLKRDKYQKENICCLEKVKSTVVEDNG